MCSVERFLDQGRWTFWNVQDQRCTGNILFIVSPGSLSVGVATVELGIMIRLFLHISICANVILNEFHFHRGQRTRYIDAYFVENNIIVEMKHNAIAYRKYFPVVYVVRIGHDAASPPPGRINKALEWPNCSSFHNNIIAATFVSIQDGFSKLLYLTHERLWHLRTSGQTRTRGRLDESLLNRV